MSFILDLLTLSYSGALKYHTTDPINKIKENDDYIHHREEVMEALAQFRLLKQEELQFVTSAVCEPFRARCHMERNTNLPLYTGWAIGPCCCSRLLMVRSREHCLGRQNAVALESDPVHLRAHQLGPSAAAAPFAQR